MFKEIFVDRFKKSFRMFSYISAAANIAFIAALLNPIVLEYYITMLVFSMWILSLPMYVVLDLLASLYIIFVKGVDFK